MEFSKYMNLEQDENINKAQKTENIDRCCIVTDTYGSKTIKVKIENSSDFLIDQTKSILV